MKVFDSLAETKASLRSWQQEGKRIGFVPTMGALHRGHLSLVELAHRLSDRVVASIFVNPLQFNDPSDLENYPAEPEHDVRLLREAGCAAVFFPTPSTMYPPGFQTQVRVPRVSEGLCGASRPGHFDGVSTVVLKLLNIVRPDVAVLGEKDFQQLVMIRRLVEDLNLDVEIASGPTVRDEDGLALSSRNRRLSKEERQRSLVLYRSLARALELHRGGVKSKAELLAAVHAVLAEEPSLKVEYVDLRSAHTLEPVESSTGSSVILIAAQLGSVRLIDNQRLDG